MNTPSECQLSIYSNQQKIDAHIINSKKNYWSYDEYYDNTKFVIICNSTCCNAIITYSKNIYDLKITTMSSNDDMRDKIIMYTTNQMKYLLLKDTFLSVGAFITFDKLNIPYTIKESFGDYTKLLIQIKSQLPFIIFTLQHFLVKDMIILVCKHLRQ